MLICFMFKKKKKNDVCNKTGLHCRRGALLRNNLLIVVAAGLLGFSKFAKSYEMLIAGRIISGINAGKLSVLEHTDNASTSHFRYQQFTTSC